MAEIVKFPGAQPAARSEPPRAIVTVQQADEIAFQLCIDHFGVNVFPGLEEAPAVRQALRSAMLSIAMAYGDDPEDAKAKQRLLSLETALRDLRPALDVLATMCGGLNLRQGAAKAIEMRGWIDQVLGEAK